MADRLVECISHPIVHDIAIVVCSCERCQISGAKKGVPQLLGQILQTAKLWCKEGLNCLPQNTK
jgi:hypothetical protein